jgi:uncharacterized membrane protein
MAEGQRQSRRNGEASAHARQAIAEWRKAVRYGAAAISPLARSAARAARPAKAGGRGGGQRPPLRERLNPSKTEKGGRIGNVADKLLSKMGTPGKVASAFALGSRALERMRDGGDDGATADRRNASVADNDFGGQLPIPIQEAIEVAVPLRTAYALATRFEEYPEFIDRIGKVEDLGRGTVTFVAGVRGRQREVTVKIVDERPRERIDWEATDGVACSGVVSFHELAPRLTHIELTVELEREGVLQRLTRMAHLPERAIRADLHRFKAYAELWEEDEDFEGGEELEDEEELEQEEELEEDEELEEEPLTASGQR